MHEIGQLTADSPAMRYRLSGSMCWRCLGGEWVVYSETPPQVCHLDQFGAAVLAIIDANPATLSEIFSEIQSVRHEQDLVGVEMMLDKPMTERIWNCLERLTSAGLIAQVGA